MTIAYRDFVLNVVAPPTGHPSWLDAITPGTWAGIGANTITGVASASATSATLRGSYFTSEALTTWSGGALLPNLGTHGTLVVGLGGAHNAYGGNGIYGFDLATQTWSELWANSWTGSDIAAPGNVYGEYNGTAGTVGAVIPNHHYYSLGGYEAQNEYFVPSAVDRNVGTTGTNAVPYGHAFNAQTRTWRRLPIYSGVNSYGGWVPKNGTLISWYDPSRQKMWVWNANPDAKNSSGDDWVASFGGSVQTYAGGLWTYDTTNGWVTQVNVPGALGIPRAPLGSGGCGVCVDPVRDVALIYQPNYLHFLKLSNPNIGQATNRTDVIGGSLISDLWRIVPAGTPPAMGLGRTGCNWSTKRNGMLLWNFNSAGPQGDVYCCSYTSGGTLNSNQLTDLVYTWSKINVGSTAPDPVMNTLQGSVNVSTDSSGAYSPYNRCRLMRFADGEEVLIYTHEVTQAGKVWVFRVP